MTERETEFADKVVVITGATGGLGKLVAHLFAKRGAKIALVGKTIEKLEDLGGQLGIARENWMAVAGDLTNEQAVQELLKEVLTTFGKVDIYLHLVGGWIGGKALDTLDRSDVSEMVHQHILSTFIAAKSFVPALVTNKWGRIIVISSPNAGNPPANNLPYSVAKAGQEALILTLAEELKGSGVTANIIRVKTIDVKHEKVTNPSEKNSSWTTPEEIGDAILYLCSEGASMVNGARLPLYGRP